MELKEGRKDVLYYLLTILVASGVQLIFLSVSGVIVVAIDLNGICICCNLKDVNFANVLS